MGLGNLLGGIRSFTFNISHDYFIVIKGVMLVRCVDMIVVISVNVNEKVDHFCS